jgi:uncharacterized surface protein with fasciclin (FAS1) repeats
MPSRLAVALLVALAASMQRWQAVFALPQFATPLAAMQADAQLSTFLTMATTGGLTSALSDPSRQVVVLALLLPVSASWLPWMVEKSVAWTLYGTQVTVFVPTDEAFTALLDVRPELGVYLNTSDLAAALAGYHGRRCIRQWC